MLLRHFTTGTLPVSILAVPGIAIEALRTHTQALSLVTALESKQGTAVVGTKDISWLWRTAYNTAVQGCSEWDNQEDTISDLFDISRQVSRRNEGSTALCPHPSISAFCARASDASEGPVHHARTLTLGNFGSCWRYTCASLRSNPRRDFTCS